MPAPKKKGLDYFPHSVDLTDDPKLVKPRIKYGQQAVYIYICLLEMIYKDEGYYLDYSDPDIVIWQLMSKCQGGKYPIKKETIADVIEDLAACELFSGDLYPEIITSKRIQETYYKVTVDRKMVEINPDIWLLSMEEMKSLSAKHCYYLFLLSADNQPINGVNRPINGVNHPIYSQSKVKESKVKESKVKESKVQHPDSGGRSYQSSIMLFEKIKGAPLTEFELNRTLDLVDTYGEQWTIEALKIMGDNGKVKISYAEGVLKSWAANGKNTKAKSYKERQQEQRQQEIARWLKANGEEVTCNAENGVNEII
jgi:hypothetical protein